MPKYHVGPFGGVYTIDKDGVKRYQGKASKKFLSSSAVCKRCTGGKGRTAFG